MTDEDAQGKALLAKDKAEKRVEACRAKLREIADDLRTLSQGITSGMDSFERLNRESAFAEVSLPMIPPDADVRTAIADFKTAHAELKRARAEAQRLGL